jgi:hypothetical protein
MEDMKAAQAPDSALARKARSEKLLHEQGVPLNAKLPAIEDEQTAQPRSKEEVAYRALCLATVAVKGEGLDQARLLDICQHYQVQEHLTPNEKRFIDNESPSDQDRTNFLWRYEACWTLLWALGFIQELGHPDHICDVPAAVTVLRERTSDQLVRDARLRPMSEILDQADLIYRYHWATVDARVKGQSPPAGLNPGVVYERHYALNWLIGYMGQDWDDVSTDT